jgi:hypothetical protein
MLTNWPIVGRYSAGRLKADDWRRGNSATNSIDDFAASTDN